MTDVEDHDLEQKKVTEIAPSLQTHNDRETKRQLLMEIVNKLYNSDEESCIKAASRDKQQILLLHGTVKSIEDTTLAP